ncbi:MAG: alanine racemase, partial [Candidatus Latescibacteria bacterium]|nr:alanine racemase [Candidatus Latescibacterota bacterium]
MLEARAYKVAEPDDIETPAMLVFADQLDNNIGVVAEMAGGAENLFVHVKTHKSAAVAHKQLAAGVAGFKCATLKELEMVLAIGAQEAILAYPMVQKIKVQRFAELAQGEAAVSAIV